MRFIERTVASLGGDGIGRADEEQVILAEEAGSPFEHPEIVVTADDTEPRTADDAERQLQVTRDEGDTR